MKVSIIIPVYNVEPYIERCLLSALNQTYDNIEIILVDDCGQDNSMDVANQAITDHKNGYKVSILKHQQNRGLSAARNTGIDSATGEYIYFLDSDDEITLNAIELLITVTKENNFIDFIIGEIETIGRTNSFNLKIKSSCINSNSEILDLFVKGKLYVMAWNKLVRKDFILKENLYFKEGILHEDILWTFFLVNKAQSMGVQQEITYKYYYRDNSIVNSLSIKNIISIFIILEEIENYFEKKIINPNINNFIYYEQLKRRTLFWLFSNDIPSNIRLRYYKIIRKKKKYYAKPDILSVVVDFSFWLPPRCGEAFIYFYFQKIRPNFKNIIYKKTMNLCTIL